MDHTLKKGIERRRDWIRRNPGGAGDYIRLSAKDRAKVDHLFTAGRKLKANEVSSLVERLTGQRLQRRRVGDIRNKALANLRGKLGGSDHYRDVTVVDNVKKMSVGQLRMASSADTEELIQLARVQEQGNPFWYH